MMTSLRRHYPVRFDRSADPRTALRPLSPPWGVSSRRLVPFATLARGRSWLTIVADRARGPHLLRRFADGTCATGAGSTGLGGHAAAQCDSGGGPDTVPPDVSQLANVCPDAGRDHHQDQPVAADGDHRQPDLADLRPSLVLGAPGWAVL